MKNITENDIFKIVIEADKWKSPKEFILAVYNQKIYTKLLQEFGSCIKKAGYIIHPIFVPTLYMEQKEVDYEILLPLNHYKKYKSGKKVSLKKIGDRWIVTPSLKLHDLLLYIPSSKEIYANSYVRLFVSEIKNNGIKLSVIDKNDEFPDIKSDDELIVYGNGLDKNGKSS